MQVLYVLVKPENCFTKQSDQHKTFTNCCKIQIAQELGQDLKALIIGFGDLR
jgi:hypothetical protein